MFTFVDEEERMKEEVDAPISLQSNKVLLDSFLNSLAACVNREMIDSAAIEFSTNLNTKHNRKKLVRWSHFSDKFDDLEESWMISFVFVLL